MTKDGIGTFETVWSTGYLQTLIQKGWLVPVERLEASSQEETPADACAILRHPRLSFISYPYEWPFELLRAAALLHLDIQLDAFDQRIVLSDASAYNIQFQGCRPIFIDHLSFRPYDVGQFWTGHQQFLQQFLNPLLLGSLLEVPYNAWYRGAPDGIPTAELERLLPLHKRLSINVLNHVVLPARFQAALSPMASLSILREARLPPSSYIGILKRLRAWIARLRPLKSENTTWRNYDQFRNYGLPEQDEKRSFVQEFSATVKPKLFLDVGCNTGEFSEIALNAGADEGVGLDFDHGALGLALQRSRDKGLRLLPLFLDVANLSPAQGWRGMERKSFTSRCNPDALLALAILHHLAIARNTPLEDAVRWLVSLAPCGIIEFVPKSDDAVRLLLQLREDIFSDYTEEHFLRIISSCTRINKIKRITNSGRLLVWYQP
ncbi:class I SAM-dependent methyltransferase [Bradyrhizobium sp.]|uniref:class I SAM-dependent methyltransferase n=1 Tax=Bradyrhizobium sp. TaxID=376 RepID=UPI0016527E65|nr:class I SAM-dependent methyltransferase [Bradyrhizobium sp.]